MWIWIVAPFLLAAIWILGVVLWQPLWVVLLASLGVFALVGLFLLIRRWRQARAAVALEKGLMAGAGKQIANTRPDRRDEIVALQEQMKTGIAALKASKGGRRALSTLPFYVIIGPPGAGKTTALKQSGLDFPFFDARGGGARGVGGTRNCDWWFTNDAILIDTAGRYSTEQDDQEEWFAFLDQLKRFRSTKPINGVLVAISIADLAQASEDQIETFAKTLRQRIDEVMVRLRMVLPVYVMLTKVDLIAGFVEFFGDLRKSERGQIWGASFPLEQSSSFDPGASFAQEFDVLTMALHARAVRRIGSERQVQDRPKIFQFPLEFQLLRENLTEFIGVLMRQNAYQETPILRGFYFTSGTQEGRPMDRILGSMAQGFGLQMPPVSDTPKELKSYFVTDLFRKVAFKDKNVATRGLRR